MCLHRHRNQEWDLVAVSEPFEARLAHGKTREGRRDNGNEKRPR